MVNNRFSKRAITLTEIVIVILITSVIMGVGMAMMRRSNIQFKKSNDLISIQRLMDNIVERIRSDVRSLKRVKKYDKNSISFVVLKASDGTINTDDDEKSEDSESDLNEITITYLFNPEENTLYRSEEGKTADSDFHGSKQIISLNFEPEFADGEKIEEQKEGEGAENRTFKSLNIAMQIASNELSGKKSDSSTLSIACQFYSTCVESELRISKIREMNNK